MTPYITKEQRHAYNGTAQAKLDTMRAHVDDRGLDLSLIERAETWISAFKHTCGSTWREPEYVFYDGVEAEIQFTWYGKRDLGIAIKPDHVEYIKMWGPDIATQSQSGAITTAQEQMDLWRWLMEVEP